MLWSTFPCFFKADIPIIYRAFNNYVRKNISVCIYAIHIRQSNTNLSSLKSNRYNKQTVLYTLVNYHADLKHCVLNYIN